MYCDAVKTSTKVWELRLEDDKTQFSYHITSDHFLKSSIILQEICLTELTFLNTLSCKIKDNYQLH